ncbi:MAG: 23S rRNA (uracil(1939)-C(5))-methyltransferase RlmD [Clostridiales bacterium]|nr:23S rRNA (uracil(1939)-C(5))-methyltransferase RlmD [Clostridiales bacterium]
MDVVLASQSPRRKELLKQIVADFRIIPSEVDEEEFRETDPLMFALRAAEAKARDVGEKYPSSLIIAADTVVNLGDETFGKPRGNAEARSILEMLSGRRHRVITAVALYKKDEARLLTGYEISHVTFRELSAGQIENYIEKGEFLDKAGSYAVQEVGDKFVAELEGDYDNVVGFPVKTVRRMLREFQSPGEVMIVTDIAFPHDWGVGRVGGAVTFVPGGVVGDRVRVVVVKAKRKHCFGRMAAVEQPSPDRAEPECPHFGVCGGCAFQNLRYERQLELKEKYLLRTLQTLGRLDLRDAALEPIIPSPTPYFYRNKMEYAFGSERGEIFLGLRERASPLEKYRKRTIRLTQCPIFSRAVEGIFPAVLEFAKSSGYNSFNPLTGSGHLRNLVLREGKATGEVLAVLVTRSGMAADLEFLAELLRPEYTSVKSLWWAENDRVPDVVEFARKKHLGGREWIEERLGGLKFKISPQSFFQPNPGGAELLYSRIKDEVKRLGVRRVLGLYCGPGSIEISVACAAGEVVGIDSEPLNIQAASENAALNGISNCRFIEGRVESALKEQAFPGFELLIVDPPRAGISNTAMKHILTLKIPNLVCVSCNPAALARDLSLLTGHGYRLRRLGSFDFFPHTPHLESLTILSR